jgi:hypothetical protein
MLVLKRQKLSDHTSGEIYTYNLSAQEAEAGQP